MGNIKKRLFFLAISIFGLFFLAGNSFAADNELDHICAYTNESVVKFREQVLKSKRMVELCNPGIKFDWPIDLCQFWISSLYGMRKHPSGQKRMHNGIDMAAFKGTDVKSVADGVVKTVHKAKSGYGNMIEINHKDGRFLTKYAHLDRIDVQEGQKVKIGSKIGLVGANGNVRGKNPYHLHFELLKNGSRVNPLIYLFPAEINYKNLEK